MLEHLPDPSTRVPQRGGGRRPPPFVDGSGRCSSIKQQAASKHQASSSKHQASSIKHQNQASVLSPINTPQKMKHFWPDRYRSFFGARLFLNLRFSDFRFWNMENKVWYYQSGPKSVSINPYGIPEPPKPLRNCQSLDWAQKTKKLQCLKINGSFLNPVMGVSFLGWGGVQLLFLQLFDY